MSAATQDRISLAQLNAMSREEFTRHFGGVLEHSPHFARRASEARPFATFDDLNRAFAKEIECAAEAEQLALLRAHPDLANRLGRLTASSTQEQISAGLNKLSADQLGEFQCLNTVYRERFGFPFIICARLSSTDAILESFRDRLRNPRETEFKTALAEVTNIARLRLHDLVESGR